MLFSFFGKFQISPMEQSMRISSTKNKHWYTRRPGPKSNPNGCSIPLKLKYMSYQINKKILQIWTKISCKQKDWEFFHTKRIATVDNFLKKRVITVHFQRYQLIICPGVERIIASSFSELPKNQFSGSTKVSAISDNWNVNSSFQKYRRVHRHYCNRMQKIMPIPILPLLLLQK